MRDLRSVARFAQIVINIYELMEEPGAERDRDAMREQIYDLGKMLGFSRRDVTEILEAT